MNSKEHEPSLTPFIITDDASEKQFVDEFIQDWSIEDIKVADTIAEQISGRVDLPQTVVIIPVAAHAEAGNIVHALEQYAHQDTSKPFAVHLHMNWPKDFSDSASVRESFAEITRAKKLFPHLDIRVSEMEYGTEPTIGAIRRSAWNGTLFKLYQQNDFEEAIGINNDIDVVKLSKSYISNVQNFYSDYYQQEMREIGAPTAATVVKHVVDEQYPNSSKAIFWKDFSSRMFKGSYEAGMVIPMTSYALADGFDSSAATHETSRFINHSLGPLPMIPGTSLTTSSRRHYDRLPENDYETIWTDESFGATDDCRTVEEFTDISNEEMVRKVSEDATLFGADYIAYALYWHLTKEEEDALISDDEDIREAMDAEITRRIKKTERMTRYVLDEALKVPRVGEFLSLQTFNDTNINHHLYVKRLSLQKSRRLLSKEKRQALDIKLMEFKDIESRES
jgi:hypothetical protein